MKYGYVILLIMGFVSKILSQDIEWNIVPGFPSSTFAMKQVQFISPDTGYLIGKGTTNRLYKTVDGGISWQAQVSFDTVLGDLQDVRSFYFLNKDTAFFGLTQPFDCGGSTYKWPFIVSYNGGKTFQYVNNTCQSFVNYKQKFSSIIFPVKNIGYCLATSIFANADQYILKTIDGGKNWNQIYTVNDGFNFSKLHFYDKDTGYAAGSLGHLYRTYNGGTSWDTLVLPDSLKNVYINDVVAITSKQVIIAGTNPDKAAKPTAIYSNDNGVTWQLKDNMSKEPVDMFFNNDTLGYACGKSLTVWKIPITNDTMKTWQKYNLSHLTGIYGNTHLEQIYLRDTTFFCPGQDGRMLATLPFQNVSMFIGVTQNLIGACQGSSFQITNNSNNYDTVIAWKINGTQVATDTDDIFVTFSDTGNVRIVLITGGSGVINPIDSLVKNVYIHPQPVADIQFNENILDTFLVGDSLSFYNNSIQETNVSWKVKHNTTTEDFNSGYNDSLKYPIVDIGQHRVILKAAGDTFVYVGLTKDQCIDQDTLYFNVSCPDLSVILNLKDTTIEANSVLNIFNQSGDEFLKYKWIVNNSEMGDTSFYDFSNSTGGIYNVKLEASIYVCKYFDSLEITVLDTMTSIGILHHPASKIYLYPNPAKDQINILTNNKKIEKIEVVNLLGKRIMNIEDIFSEKVNISTKNFTSGLYLIRCMLEDQTVQVLSFEKANE